MKTRKLGSTDIYLSELGFGCASVWGKSFFSEDEAISLFFDAYNQGITFFDTGFSYNEAELRLGKCVSQIGSENRHKLVIATKCGTRIDNNGRYYHDWSVEWLRQSLQISLQRLNTDYVDMLHLHGPSIKDITQEVLSFLDEMKSKGIVRAVGINSFDTDVLEYVCENKLFDFVMLDYNIMKQERENLIDRLTSQGIGVIAGSSLAQSLYSNRIFKIHSKKDIWYFLRAFKNFRKNIFKGIDFRFLNNVAEFTGNQLALRFVLDNNNISSAVFGTTNPSHLKENIKSTDITMPENIRNKIIKYGNKLNNKKLKG